jgi:hypothetical protein
MLVLEGGEEVKDEVSDEVHVDGELSKPERVGQISARFLKRG